MLNSKRVLSLLLIFFAWFQAGCTGGEQSGSQAKAQQAGNFFLSVNTNPMPPEVGSSAEIIATVKQDGQPAKDCRVRFRQHMPGMEMSSDKTYFDMVQDGASGVYRARGGEFSMGGEWVVEIALDCNGTSQTVKFPYRLEWPQ